mmetsp:Transcript_6371/g.11826  ORF Transcript_6371/g.11826 Transcript_6371/m.11826 type:complete len:420 (+) Transcript_6371:62-1321(+)
MVNVNVCSLSGETVAVLDVLPTETISDLKDKLHSSIISASIFDLHLSLDGACIDDTTRVEDLNFGADAQLQMIRSCKGAREILFNSPEVALQLAEHYDALQDACRECIGSLFIDDEGKARSCRANMEVLIHLHQKLSKVESQSNGLASFRAALAHFAFETLRENAKIQMQDPNIPPSVYHVNSLVRVFPWLGLEAVQVLLGSDVHVGAVASLATENVQSTLVSEYARRPIATLRELLQQLPPTALHDSDYGTLSPQDKLRRILEEAIHRVDQTPYVFPPPQSETVSASLMVMETPKEVLAVVRRQPYTLHMSKNGDVDLLCHGASTRKANCNTVLAAIKQDPAMMLGSIESYPLALLAVEQCPGAYNYLSEDFKMDRQVLYVALAHDFALRQEFVNTASKTEIQQWRWHVDEQQRKRKQ